MVHLHTGALRLKQGEIAAMMTKSTVRHRIRRMGLKVSIIDDEYRVAYVGLSKEREEATAYYTYDPRDAVLTAIRMKEEGYRG